MCLVNLSNFNGTFNAKTGIVADMVEIHYFAAARAAAGVSHELVDAPATLGELLNELTTTHTGTTEAGMSLGEVLERCTFLVDGKNAERAATLEGATRVDVLPPFAGG